MIREQRRRKFERKWEKRNIEPEFRRWLREQELRRESEGFQR